MTIRTKASAKAQFETGDRPTQADFSDLIDSVIFTPGTTAVGLLAIESTVSSSVYPIGAIGAQLISAITTASANNIIGTGVSHGVINANTTASALSALGLVFGSAADQIVTFSSGQNISGLAEVITGHIEAPSNKQYTLDRYAAFPYQVEWIAVKTSAGRVTTALKVEGSAMVGITGLRASATEVIGSAGNGKSVAVGNTLILETSANSAGADLVFTVKIVRTP